MDYNEDKNENEKQYQEYHAEIAAWNWEGIVSDLDDEEPDEMDGLQTLFIGTVCSLVPSGKYYTPWANSNVTKEEADLDAAWYEALDAVADEHGMFVTCGEGDPCDVFVARVPDEDEGKED